jgi:DNA/RNA endonuclease YhcR with UshA esterase domain
MFIRDASGGLGIFKNANLPGIPVLNEGDSVRVVGKVECFRGLSQIVPDSMVILATGRPLKMPDVVTSIGESQESNLVKMENLVVNPATWPTTPSGGGFTAKAFNGSDSIAIRIDNDCPLFNQPTPTAVVNITGMVGQFIPGNPQPVAPFPATGYQLIPRRVADLEVSTYVATKLLTEDITLYPNPGNNHIKLRGTAYSGSVKITDLRGRILKSEQLFSGNTISMADVPDGVYFIHLTGKTLRWVKQTGN